VKYGDILRNLRNKKELSQKELSDRLHLNRSTYARYETSQTQPDYDTLAKFADFYDVSIDYLLGRTNEIRIPTEQSLDDKIAHFIAKYPNMNLMFDGLDQMDDERKERMLDRIIEMIEFDNYKEDKKK